ncbi:MAG: hypothetical protein HYX61_05710 [Gammaproteobacteria bacterium]|jgi:ankyrin repeat protein|nr:hypothetical protein [Gammaproteobacteria bacterium]
MADESTHEINPIWEALAQHLSNEELQRAKAAPINALMDAAYHGQYEVVELLMQIEQVNERSSTWGVAAYENAVMNGHHKVAELFLHLPEVRKNSNQHKTRSWFEFLFRLWT